MLQVKDVTLSHRQDLKVMIDRLNFTINAGEKVAIIGDEGVGKSTLLQWILHPDQEPDYVQITGEVINRFQKTGYLPQFIPPDIQAKPVASLFFETDQAAYLDYAQLYQHAQNMGLDTQLLESDRWVGTLSGGQQMKVQLLALLASEPDLILLDEPSNNLDIRTLEWLEHFMKTSPATFLFISHDEALLKAVATKIIHCELQKHRTIPKVTVANLAYDTYVTERLHRLSHQDQVARKQRADYQQQMARYRHVASSVQKKLEATKNDVAGRLLAKKYKTLKSMEARFERQKQDFLDIPYRDEVIDIRFDHVPTLPANKVLLDWHHHSLTLPTGKVIPSLTLQWRTPEKIGIIGENGVGKSTLLRQMKAALAGSRLFTLGYMPQNYEEVFQRGQVAVEFLQRQGSREELSQIMTYLGSLKFTREEMARPLDRLSGGQKAKLLLIKMDLEENAVLLLDEPSRNFSPLSQPALRQVFRDFPGAICMISHDRLMLKEVCDHVYELTPHGLVQIEI